MENDKIKFVTNIGDTHDNTNIEVTGPVPVKDKHGNVISHAVFNKEDMQLSFDMTEEQCVGMLQDMFGIGIEGNAIEQSGSYINSFKLNSVSLIPKK